MPTSTEIKQELAYWQEKLEAVKEQLHATTDGADRQPLLLERMDIESRLEGLEIDLRNARTVEREAWIEELSEEAERKQQEYQDLADENIQIKRKLYRADQDLKQYRARISDPLTDEEARELKRLMLLVEELKIDAYINERLKNPADIASRHAHKKYQDAVRT